MAVPRKALALGVAKHPTIEGFWSFCQERESIRLRKESGNDYPWTEDIVLQMYFFCNVKREYDTGTRWYLENVASIPEEDFSKWVEPDLLWRTILYRSVNSIEYFEGIWYTDRGGVFGPEDWKKEKKEIQGRINKAPPPSNHAYIVLQGPDGAGRKIHLREQLDYLEKNIEILAGDLNKSQTLKDVWKLLQQVPYVGPFIALQIYRDLILADALPFDDDDFTYLGPGARSGLALFGFDQYKAQYLALQEIQKAHPPGLELNLGDVEQAMCEYRKWINLKNGGGRHRYYRR